MATVTISSILNKVRIILQDPDVVRWDTDELIGWLNDAQREIVLLKPDANSTAYNLILAASNTRQSIPPNGIALIDVVRNTDGQKRAIRQINREVLDAQKPEWHSSDSSTTVQYFIFDDRNPRSFLVFPPTDSTYGQNEIEIIYSKSPSLIAALYDASYVATDIDILLWEDAHSTDTPYTPLTLGASLNEQQVLELGRSHVIELDDVYANVIADYILYRAYSKDAEYAANGQRAMAAYSSFAQSLGLKSQAETLAEPRNAATSMR
jgi:hypothetical protein